MQQTHTGSHAAPTFLVVGVAKAGTTSLYEYLIQHPDVFVPDVKETFYFVSDVYAMLSPNDPHAEAIRKRTIRGTDEYRRLFAGMREHSASGEVATFYAYHYRTAIPWIRRELGDIPIVMMLRNPVERAFSAYCHFRGYSLETLSFEEALKTEDRREAENWYTMWYYRKVGLYADQVQAFQNAFSRVLVCLNDDFSSDAEGLMQRIYAFIGVDDAFRPDISVRFMVSGNPRNRALHALTGSSGTFKSALTASLSRLLPEHWRHRIKNRIRMKNLVKPEMLPETRRELSDYYRSDVARLECLTGRNLLSWVSAE